MQMGVGCPVCCRYARQMRGVAVRGLAARALIWAGAVASGLGWAGSGAGSAASDPGVLLELDRERYELNVRDLHSGESGPPIRVALGSPAHATPAGSYPVTRVIFYPAWQPNPEVQAAGSEPLPPSLDGPMGVAKLPFADLGSVALHGGGDPLLLGKLVSGGCVRARDADLLRVIAWLYLRRALGPAEPQKDGEVIRFFQRPVRMQVR
jgi:hypothetical protein